MARTVSGDRGEGEDSLPDPLLRTVAGDRGDDVVPVEKKEGADGALSLVSATAKPGHTIQPFDIRELTKGLKQTQSVTGRAITPELLEGVAKGAIGAQAGSAVEAVDRAKTRELQEKQINANIADSKRRAKIASDAAKTAGGAQVGSLVGAGLGLAVTAGNPLGAAVGSAIGGTAGGILSGASVLCTELERQGIIPKRLNVLATAYRIKNIDIDVYEGYLMWATPLTRLMQKSKLITWTVSLIWVPVTYEMAHRVNPKIKSSWYGKLLYEGLSIFSKGIYQRRATCQAYSKI